MRLFKSSVAVVLGGVLWTAVPSSDVSAAEMYDLDQPHSQIMFSVSRGGWTNINGWFESFEGEIAFDEANVANSKVTASIETGSINTGFERRDAHLASPDFFASKEFPTMTFESTSIEQTGDNTGKMTGELTMLGVTNPVVLDVVFNRKAVNPRNDRMFTGFTATGVLKRSDFGMKYGAPAIGDEVSIRIEALAGLK